MASTNNAARPVRSAVTARAEFIALALPATTVCGTATNGQPITVPVEDIRIEWCRGAVGIALERLSGVGAAR